MLRIEKFIADWQRDHTFDEIVERLEELDAAGFLNDHESAAAWAWVDAKRAERQGR